VARLTAIPGVGRQAAAAVVAEVGPDRGRFPGAGHLASWAGRCPGKGASAGKRRRGRTARGNPWWQRARVQAAWAASHTQGTYRAAPYRRRAARRGRPRAPVARGHTRLGVR
jgi:transposase